MPFGSRGLRHHNPKENHASAHPAHSYARTRPLRAPGLTVTVTLALTIVMGCTPYRATLTHEDTTMNLKLILDTLSGSAGITGIINQAMDAGLGREESVSVITDLIDDLIDWSLIIPDPAISLLVEAVDGPVIKFAILLTWRRVERMRDAGGARRKIKSLLSHADH